MLARLRDRARSLKRDVAVLWLAARDPQVPLGAKLLAGAVAAYALSPIDVIPDFIPVLGYVDDLLLVPLGIWLALRLISPPVIERLRATAVAQGRAPRSLAGALVIAGIWLLAGVAMWRWWLSR